MIIYDEKNSGCKLLIGTHIWDSAVVRWPTLVTTEILRKKLADANGISDEITEKRDGDMKETRTDGKAVCANFEKRLRAVPLLPHLSSFLLFI